MQKFSYSLSSLFSSVSKTAAANCAKALLGGIAIHFVPKRCIHSAGETLFFPLLKLTEQALCSFTETILFLSAQIIYRRVLR